MDELQIGDSVQTANGQFSALFMFTHKDDSAISTFVQIETQSRQVTVTSGHYVYCENGLKTAGSVAVGDMLQTENGQIEEVVSIQKVQRKGLYNPQTLCGELLVNGIRVSAYTTAVKPSTANTLLAPMRAAYSIMGIDISGSLFWKGDFSGICKLFLRASDKIENI